MIIGRTAARLWRQLLLFIEQLIIPVIDLPQEKLKVSFSHKTLKYCSSTRWSSGFELRARQRIGSFFFPFWINAHCWVEGARSSLAGRVREPGCPASLEQAGAGPLPPVSILHLREPFLTATPEDWHTGATTLHLCNNKFCRVSGWGICVTAPL